MGLKFAMASAFAGNKVGIYSGEMSMQQLQERMLCCAKPNYTSTQEEALQVIKEKNAFVHCLTQKELRRRANVSDIEEFKQTILYTYTLNTEYRNELLKYYGHKITSEDLEEVRNILKEIMENTYKLSVPLKVDINEGENLYEAK